MMIWEFEGYEMNTLYKSSPKKTAHSKMLEDKDVNKTAD